MNFEEPQTESVLPENVLSFPCLVKEIDCLTVKSWDELKVPLPPSPPHCLYFSVFFHLLNPLFPSSSLLPSKIIVQEFTVPFSCTSIMTGMIQHHLLVRFIDLSFFSLLLLLFPLLRPSSSMSSLLLFFFLILYS